MSPPTRVIKYEDVLSPWQPLCVCSTCKWWSGWRPFGHVCRKPGGRHKGTVMASREQKDCWECDL